MSEVFPFLSDPDSVGMRFDPWDQVLYQTEHFVVVPTVGAIVEGWVLIVPKRPYLCVGEIPEEHIPEFLNIKRIVISVLNEIYGQVAAFEHGPSRVSQKVGCGVDHAHLHVVPVKESLLEGVGLVTDAILQWRRIDSMSEVQEAFFAKIPYLLVEQPVGTYFIADASTAPSQLFRRVIANWGGVPQAFDWKSNPMAGNVLSTLDRLQVRFGKLQMAETVAS